MHDVPAAARPIASHRVEMRDLSLEVVAARCLETRAAGRTPCDVCGAPATMFVRCDAEHFNSFRCAADMIPAAKYYHERGFEVICERLANVPPATTDIRTAVQAIVDEMEDHPFRFAVRFLTLERLVQQLHARLEGAR